MPCRAVEVAVYVMRSSRLGFKNILKSEPTALHQGDDHREGLILPPLVECKSSGRLVAGLTSAVQQTVGPGHDRTEAAIPLPVRNVWAVTVTTTPPIENGMVKTGT